MYKDLRLYKTGKWISYANGNDYIVCRRRYDKKASLQDMCPEALNLWYG